MSTVLNVTPSTVMVESYNNKLEKIINYKDDDILSWTINGPATAGLVPVAVTLRNGDTKMFNAMRYNLSDILSPNEDGYVLLNRAAMNVYMQDYLDLAVGFQKQIADASGVDLENDELLFSNEFEHTLLFWGITGNFIPPQEISVIDISKSQTVIDYVATLNTNIVSTNTIAAKENSLGFVGEIKVLVIDDDAFEPPIEEVVRKYDLDKATNCGIPGEWHVFLERETADMSDFDFEVDLTRLMNGEFYIPGGLNITNTELQRTISHDGINTTYTITPVDKSIENEVGGTLDIVYKEQVPFNLSIITNNDEPGAFNYPYHIISEWNTQTAEQIGQAWFYAWGGLQNITYKYSRFKYETADDIVTPEGHKAIRVTPADDTNRFRTIGELILFIKELTEAPLPITILQLNNGGFFGPTNQQGKWSVPPGYDIELEMMRMADQIVTQQNSGHQPWPTDIVKVQDIVLTEVDGIVTVKPHPNSIWIRVTGVHTVKLIVDETLTGVDRDYEAFDLSLVSNVDIPGTWTVTMAKGEGFDTTDATYFTDALTAISALYPDYNLIIDDIVADRTTTQVQVTPKFDDKPCRTKGFLKIVAEYPKIDLSLITNNDTPGTWTHITSPDRTYTSQMRFDVIAAVEQQFNLGIEASYIDFAVINSTSFKLFTSASAPLPAATTGELIVNFTIEAA